MTRKTYLSENTLRRAEQVIALVSPMIFAIISAEDENSNSVHHVLGLEEGFQYCRKYGPIAGEYE